MSNPCNEFPYMSDLCECLNVRESSKDAEKTLNMISRIIQIFMWTKPRKDGNDKTRSDQLRSLKNLKKAIDNTTNQLDFIFQNIDRDDNFYHLRALLNNTSDYPEYKPCKEINQDKQLNTIQDVKNFKAMKRANYVHFEKGKPLLYKSKDMYLGGWKDLYKYLIHTKKHIENFEKQIIKKPTKKALDRMIINLVALFKQRHKLGESDDYKSKRDRFVQLCLEIAFEKSLITDIQKEVSTRLLNQAEKEAVNVTFEDSEIGHGMEGIIPCDLNLRK